MTHARLFTVLLATAAATLPLRAVAIQDPHAGYREYRIEFTTDNVHSLNGGATVGILDLKTEDNGIINGFYRPNDGGRITEIDGSRDGKAVNLRTNFGRLNLNGTYDHGKIVGSGFIGENEVDFIATPQDGPPQPAPELQAQQ